MKQRSPVLGYNHNVRYAGRVWHVQTEDSGVQAPHIFTHLFSDGTILASSKTDYDAASDVAIVQKLMQTQHKTMLRDLKRGAFDEKIERYYGPIARDTIETEVIDDGSETTAPTPRSEPDVPPPDPPEVRERTSQDDRPTVPDLTPLLPPPAARAPTATLPPGAVPDPARVRTTLTPSRPSIAVNARSGSVNARPGPPTPPPTVGANRSAPPTIGGNRAAPTIGSNRGANVQRSGVVVARPTVIVGGEKHGAADFWKTERRAPPDPAFGQDLISEKSLDEVILAYLSEDVPKK